MFSSYLVFKCKWKTNRTGHRRTAKARKISDNSISEIKISYKQKNFSFLENKIKKEEFFLYSILDPGFYSKHIKKFQSVFPAEQIKIIVFEEYIKNVEFTIKSILDFLDLDTSITFKEQKKGAYRAPKNKISNKLLQNTEFRNIAAKIIPTVYRQKIGDKFLVKQTKKPSMLTQERKNLEKIYEIEVKNLQNLLNRKLPWKDFQ